MKMQWMLILILTLSNSVLAAPSKPAPRKPKEGQNEAAIRHHKEGLRHRDTAWVYEEKMSVTEGKAREAYARFIQELYNRALGEFVKATELDSTYYQAFSSLGYIKRKTGDMDGALSAYNHALTLNPNYAEAIEYRAETYLIVGRVEEMKKAYGVLAALNRPHAARLLTFVTQWADSVIDADMATSLRTWASEQKEKLGEVKTFVEKW